MQREIKFRSWDINTKKMITPDMLKRLFLNVQTLARVPDKHMYENGLYIPFTGDIYMQYTGLKDKNGKEIYEGDIVICTDGECYQGINEFYKKIKVDNINNWYTMQILSESGFTEVIGNIHENSELLKESEG